jgi:hypothetical protein
MRISKLLLTVILFLLLPPAAFSGTRHPSTPDEKHVEYGKKFTYITRIMAREVSTGKPQFASAVLIAPNWALTAAHVVHGTKDVAILMNDDKVVIKIPKVIEHKDFDPSNDPGFYDIALCYSDKDFGLDFYPELYKDGDEEGKICSIAGYGLNGDFKFGVTNADTKRRAGSNKIERCERNVLICTPSNTPRTELEYLICMGDSGGGLFIGNKLAGINSFVTCDVGKVPDSSYHTEAAHTRISLYYDWVKSQIELHDLTVLGRLTLAPNIEEILEK